MSTEAESFLALLMTSRGSLCPGAFSSHGGEGSFNQFDYPGDMGLEGVSKLSGDQHVETFYGSHVFPKSERTYIFLISG